MTPSPYEVALAAFWRVCGAFSAPATRIAPALIVALQAASYLRDETPQGMRIASDTIDAALKNSGLISADGTVASHHGPEATTRALEAVAASGQFTDIAMARLDEKQ
ncbi:hypothetical protein ABZ897_51025 [Nonomuraea sp. NPDC046802]|uniref:hypothetical protein n=1 Tax=Nonomuraea sp. NPDC046802 TaxID=3154919 RepID=UPI0033FC1864